MSKVGILAYAGGTKSATAHTPPHAKIFPDMSDSAAFEAFIEDGVPGTILIVYNDALSVGAHIDLTAFIVLVSGNRVTVTGVGVSPMADDNFEIEFTPPAVHGDVVTFQYDCRIDPSFQDAVQNKPIDFALNPIQNQIAATGAAADIPHADDTDITTDNAKITADTE